MELHTRLVDFNPLEQRLTMESRVRLWHEGDVVQEDQVQLQETQYFCNELRLLLELVGFATVEVYGGYSTRPARPYDVALTFVAHRG